MTNMLISELHFLTYLGIHKKERRGPWLLSPRKGLLPLSKAYSDDMANLFSAIFALKKIPWFKTSVWDIRAFKVENWSNFTDIVKED